MDIKAVQTNDFAFFAAAAAIVCCIRVSSSRVFVVPFKLNIYRERKTKAWHTQKAVFPVLSSKESAH